MAIALAPSAAFLLDLGGAPHSRHPQSQPHGLIALAPSAAFLLDLGGTPVLATLTLGLMVSYILAPSAAFLLDLGGASVLATLTLGLMVSYILNFKFGAFFGVWMYPIASHIAFFFSATSSLISAFNSLPLDLLAAFLYAHTTFLVGAWASLQFKNFFLMKLLFLLLPSFQPTHFSQRPQFVRGNASKFPTNAHNLFEEILESNPLCFQALFGETVIR